ncbi:response regulator [Roseisalinus antarcticus]|uniref:KDP operon transcriptional regulatory protein KdpE n=1 Tax=Roseisalinus antarcticus TaxID=254357 RepID=A0A1Y5TUU2_9RHOB|nr:response regulator [Roseisalinus antarcticus]SLN72399.1 KDP operon transcriptional regulatory protein KdpE [Roseisalinus antarcticus]
MDTLDTFLMSRPPTAAHPLLGVTVLVVEDSRFACEAMRLMCLRSGARIRRADSLEHARRHLRVYRPTCVIVDLGLPDGRGEELLKELSTPSAPIEVLLATSGDADAEQSAMEAGAMGFLAKPILSIAVFQQAILSRLPPERQPRGPRAAIAEGVAPDPLALRDDLAAVASTLQDDAEGTTVDYVAQFLGGVARSAGDEDLSDAVRALIARRAEGRQGRAELAHLTSIVHDRLDAAVPI